MRSWIAIGTVLGVLACGSPGDESESAEPLSRSQETDGVRADEPERAEESGSESEGGSGGEGEGTASAAPSCDRVQPCIEAFIELAPAELAAPARVALTQLPASLVETTAREPSCRAAIASYRHDLETHELDVPDACR